MIPLYYRYLALPSPHLFALRPALFGLRILVLAVLSFIQKGRYLLFELIHLDVFAVFAHADGRIFALAR